MTVIKEVTCTEDGEAEYVCERCGYTYRGPLKTPGHRYLTYNMSPTCTEYGYTDYTCEYCGDHYEGDIVPALGHHFEGGYCTICGQPQ